MPSALVDGSGHLSALNMNDAEIHIRRTDCCCECFVAVSDQEHNIRIEPPKLTGKLDHGEAHGFSHRRRRGAFYFDVYLAVDMESIGLYDLHRLPEAFEDHGAGGNDL